MPLPSLLTRLLHDGCYSVPTGAIVRCSPLGKTPLPDDSQRQRLQQDLTLVRTTLGAPATRQGRDLLREVDCALDLLSCPGADPRAWRKLPTRDTVEQWLESARFDPRIRPERIAELNSRGHALVASLAEHGIPGSSRLHRDACCLAADIARDYGARSVSARTVRQLHERLEAMDQALLDFRCHRGALWEARADADQMNAGIRHLETLPRGVSAKTVRQLRGAHDRLKASLEQAAGQLAVGDLRAVHHTVAGMAGLRLSLLREIAALDGAYAMRYRPRVTPASVPPDSTPFPAPG